MEKLTKEKVEKAKALVEFHGIFDKINDIQGYTGIRKITSIISGRIAVAKGYFNVSIWRGIFHYLFISHIKEYRRYLFRVPSQLNQRIGKFEPVTFSENFLFLKLILLEKNKKSS